jgi:antitoxin component of MazEF toxin-antitoxin module
MTLVVRSSKGDTISLPVQLLALLNLREGDEVKTVVDGHTLHLTPLDRFLALRGALRDDEAFDAAIEFLDKAWQQWAALESA